MILLKQEKIDVTSDNGSLILTNIRVQYQVNELGKAKITSILLKNIASIEVTYKSNLLFAVIAAIVLATSLLASSYLFYGAIVSIIFIVLFILSRRHYLVISSKGGAKVNLLVKGMKTDKVLGFLNRIEENITSIK